MSLRLVEVSDKYINYMKSFFYSTMMDNKEGRRSHSRKYVGVMLEINGFKYFAPLSSPKNADYLPDGTIRYSSKVILRMVASPNTSKPVLLGTIKLNNMMPVPDSEISEYDHDNEPDLKYKTLVDDELLWIQRNNTSILKAAKLLHNLKCNEAKNTNENNRKFYESIMPFDEAEKKCSEFKFKN